MHDYDYVAALYTRNWLQAELNDERDAPLHELGIDAAALLDARFDQLTEVPDGDMMATILREMRVPVEDSVGWWWKRVPSRGRVRDQIEGAAP